MAPKTDRRTKSAPMDLLEQCVDQDADDDQFRAVPRAQRRLQVATWDIGLTEESPSLRSHWWATKVSAEHRVWSTRITPDDLWNKPTSSTEGGLDQLMYVAIGLPELRMNHTVPILKRSAHVTVSYGYRFQDNWGQFWRWRTAICALLTARTVTCIFMRNDAWNRFDISLDSELGCLITQIREVGRDMGVEEPEPFEGNFHVTWQ